MKFPLSCLAALGILCVGGSFAQDSWVTEGFEQFSRGTFGNAGQNLYVSKAGVLQRIYQFDLDKNGWTDLVFAMPNHKILRVYSQTDIGFEWRAFKDIPSMADVVTAGDFDGDGLDDVAVASQVADPADKMKQTSWIWLNSAEGFVEKNRLTVETRSACTVRALENMV